MLATLKAHKIEVTLKYEIRNLKSQFAGTSPWSP